MGARWRRSNSRSSSSSAASSSETRRRRRRASAVHSLERSHSSATTCVAARLNPFVCEGVCDGCTTMCAQTHLAQRSFQRILKVQLALGHGHVGRTAVGCNSHAGQRPSAHTAYMCKYARAALPAVQSSGSSAQQDRGRHGARNTAPTPAALGSRHISSPASALLLSEGLPVQLHRHLQGMSMHGVHPHLAGGLLPLPHFGTRLGQMKEKEWRA